MKRTTRSFRSSNRISHVIPQGGIFWCLAAVVACFLAAAGPVQAAATLYWTNASGGSWETIGNWKPNTQPGYGNDIYLTNLATGPYTVIIDSNTVVNAPSSLVVYQNGGQGLNISGGANLLVNYTNNVIFYITNGAAPRVLSIGWTDPGLSTFTLSNGNVQVGNGSFSIGTAAGSDARLQLYGGTFDESSGASIKVGNGSGATGTVDAAGTPYIIYNGGTIGFAAGSVGYFYARGTSTNIFSSGSLYLGAAAGSWGRAEVKDNALVQTPILQLGTGSGGTGIVVVSGNGTLIQTNWGTFNYKMGEAGAYGQLIVSNGLADIRTSLGYIGDQAAGYGEVDVYGGSLYMTNGSFNVGNLVNSTGKVEIAGGVATIKALNVGYSGVGTATIEGGVFTNTGDLSISSQNGGTGTLIVAGSGNAVVVGKVNIANNLGGYGLLSVSNGSFTGVGALTVGTSGGGVGRVEVSGGTADFVGAAPFVGRNGGTGTVLVTGGTLAITNSGGIQLNIGGGVGASRGEVRVDGGHLISDYLFLGGIAGGGMGYLTINGGSLTLTGSHRIDVGTSSPGEIDMTGGTLDATAASSSVNVGSSGNIGTFSQSGGLANMGTITIGTAAISPGTWTISGGTGLVTTLINVGKGTASTGTVNVTGGVLDLRTTLNLGPVLTGVGILNVSSGTVYMTDAILGNNTGAAGIWNIYGGVSAVTNGNLLMSRVAGSLSSMLITNGELDVMNGELQVGGQSSFSPDSQVLMSNGTVNVKSLSVGGAAAISYTGRGGLTQVGGTITVTNALTVGNSGNGSTGTMLVANSAVLQMNSPSTITLGNGTTGRGYLTNANGGTVRFVGMNNPTITVNTGSSFVNTNATIEFKDAGAANIGGNIAGALVSYQGTNTLRLINTTTTVKPTFNLDNASAGTGARFAYLQLTNASTFSAGVMTNFGLGVVTLYDTGTLITTNSLVNLGRIQAAAGSAPSVTVTSLYNQASGVITGAIALTVRSGMTNAGAITLNGGYAAIGGSVTNSGTVRLLGGTTGSINGPTVDNSGGLLADSSSSLTMTTTALFNQASGVITGLVTMTVNGGVTNAGSIVLLGGSAKISGPVTNSGTMRFSSTSTGAINGPLLQNSGTMVFAGGSSGTFSNTFVNNNNLILADSTSPLSIVATTLLNRSSGIITGRVSLLTSGGLTNAGIIHIDSGNLTVGGILSNGDSAVVRLLNGAGSFGEVQNGGTLDFSSSVSSFAGVMTNNGTVRTINSVGTFNAVVVNNGAWISDPSTNTFLSGYTIGNNGSLSMGAGDVFQFNGGNFVNSSTQSNTYNTIDGKFVFNGGPGATQVFAVAGLNLAALTPTGTNDVGLNGGSVLDPHSISYFQNNFALGTLEIAANTTVEVWNASSGSLAGLFLSNLVMGANSQLIISNAVQVYYISTNAAFGANVVLLQPIQGLGDASGFHELVIPEPSTLLLAGAGLLTLWRARKRVRK